MISNSLLGNCQIAGQAIRWAPPDFQEEAGQKNPQEHCLWISNRNSRPCYCLSMTPELDINQLYYFEEFYNFSCTLKYSMKQPDHVNISDPALWLRFRNGDREALSAIYKQHHKSLFNYGIRFCRNNQVVEDCIQDMFLELWKSRQGLSPTDSIRYYLLKVLRNKIYAYLQSKTCLLQENIHPDGYDFHVEYSFEDQLIGELMNEEIKSRLTQALNTLSARQKEIIYLRFYNHLDYTEIASVMGIRYQSARTHVYQAIKLLREQFALPARLSVLLSGCFFS
jgi:RNA polymerase sigma factor (sigma-70 family)